MYQLGYQWLVLDDCWHPTRAQNGTLVPLKSSFPRGMKVVADYVHSKGLKFGLYTSVGKLTFIYLFFSFIIFSFFTFISQT